MRVYSDKDVELRAGVWDLSQKESLEIQRASYTLSITGSIEWLL